MIDPKYATVSMVEPRSERRGTRPGCSHDGMTVARQRVVIIQFTEAAAESDMLLARDLLVAKQENAAFQERAMDLVELGVAERLADIDALDFGAERVGQGSHGNGHDADLVDRMIAYRAHR